MAKIRVRDAFRLGSASNQRAVSAGSRTIASRTRLRISGANRSKSRRGSYASNEGPPSRSTGFLRADPTSVDLRLRARCRREAEIAALERRVAAAVAREKLGLPPLRARVDLVRIEHCEQPCAHPRKHVGVSGIVRRRRRVPPDRARGRRAAADTRRSARTCTPFAQHERARHRAVAWYSRQHGAIGGAPARRGSRARCRDGRRRAPQRPRIRRRTDKRRRGSPAVAARAARDALARRRSAARRPTPRTSSTCPTARARRGCRRGRSCRARACRRRARLARARAAPCRCSRRAKLTRPK